MLKGAASMPVSSQGKWTVTKWSVTTQLRSLATYTGWRSSTEYTTRSQSSFRRFWPRKNRAIWLTSSGSMFHHLIYVPYVPATETYYRRTAPTSSSLIARSLKPHLQCK